MNKQASFYQYATSGERRAARALVRALLADGCALSVHDSEEWTVSKSTKETEILEALATSGEDVIRVRKNGQRMGWFSLIWGNDPEGRELISDYSYNSYCETVVNKISPVSF